MRAAFKAVNEFGNLETRIPGGSESWPFTLLSNPQKLLNASLSVLVTL